MLFENIIQYDKAKKELIENGGDVNEALYSLLKDPDFKNLSEGEIRLCLSELNEGLGERIANFLGDFFGGDINKIKTTLVQMKEQELKFNREEYDLYKELYSLLQDKREKLNPDYKSIQRQLDDDINALNLRYKELSKAHDEIFNALEDKIKVLIGDNKRKIKYFNAQRATDVKETRNDRYDKIRALTSKSPRRERDLNRYFGVDLDDLKREADEAEKDATKKVGDLPKSYESYESYQKISSLTFTENPEKELSERLIKIMKGTEGFSTKKHDLKKLEDDIEISMNEDEFDSYTIERKKLFRSLLLNTKKYLRELNEER